MSILTSFHRFAGAALVGSLLTLGGCVFGPITLEHETRVLTVAQTSASPVVVRTANGAVSIDADPAAADVSITAELKAQTQERLEKTKIVASRDADGTLRVEVAWADGQRLNSEGCDFDITVPNARDVNVETSNGSISIADLAGKAFLRSSNGRITATRHQGDVDADTSNGSISVTDPGGAVRADSSNGAIEVENAPARVDADTSNGRITITLADSSPGPVIADSSNGSIRLTVGSAFSGRLVLDTSNSRIETAGIRNRPDAKLSMRKSSGTIEFGTGGEPSSCTTSNGSITVGTRN